MRNTDLFGNDILQKPFKVNIYADEIQSKKCPCTQDEWFYIGIIVEDLEHSLLDDLKKIRYCGNFDKNSSYYVKNDRIVHWVDVNDIDTKNICKRWLEYILNPEKSSKTFYAYILGINNSKLNNDEFGDSNKFNTKYNRFFRSCILYALKCFSPDKSIIVENIYHERGQQQNHEYFPWHCIHKIESSDKSIQFKCGNITFLDKDHRENCLSNIIQLTDLFLGLSTSLIHGIQESKTSKYRKELMDLVLPLLQRMVEKPDNKNSSYKHSNRIMIRFFPKERTGPDDIMRWKNQFYCNRIIYYLEEKSCQMQLFSYGQRPRIRKTNRPDGL